MLSRSFLRLSALAALALPLAGVAALTLPVAGCDCVDLGVAELRPGPEVTLSVGGTFTAELWEGGVCSDDRLRRQERRWGTPDSLVVRVDSLTGQVRALAVGEAMIWGRYPGMPADSRVEGIRVHVR